MANELTAPRGLELSSRLLLALMITIFGANKFWGFMPTPAAPEDGAKFLGALFASGYIFNTIGVMFLLSAFLLVIRRVVFALFLLAPIAFHIIAYHLAFDPAGIGAGAVLTALMLLVSWCHRGAVKSALFAAP
jgi:hypothetical protein